MKKTPFVIIAILLAVVSCMPVKQNKDKTNNVITTEVLKDKIKGGWAGQVIGLTFGGPTEFRYAGTMINDYRSIEWSDTSILWYFTNTPSLYDDVYMDLTFVEVLEKEGPNAPASSHAKAFANAEYLLWHGNQAARYNILNGIMPPESGHWIHNPHSEDIDFQIEADFAGLMCPGLVNAASAYCDKVGHIMNYGDGWYGGVYMAAMYALAFVSDDIDYIVNEALQCIPREAGFYQCIHDVISWHEQYPDDWKKCWFEIQKKWSSDVGCPDGVFNAFNIDAKVNAAYVVTGLLYGNGDYTKTLEISTRCGQDSDCNPASAGGILGTVMGYSNIPEEWKRGIYAIEDIDFMYTNMSLNDVYDIGFKHALKVLENNNAMIHGDTIVIPQQKIQPVDLEIGFEDHYPVKTIEKPLGKTEVYVFNNEHTEYSFDFEGKGFVVNGFALNKGWTWFTREQFKDNYNLKVDVFIDGKLKETSLMPTKYEIRKEGITWAFNLPKGKHEVKLVLKNPSEKYELKLQRIIIYSDKPVGG